MMSSRRVHAALDSHTSGSSATLDHQNALQAAPSLSNFELKGRPGASSTLLLDGHLYPTDIRETQEHLDDAVNIAPAPPAKQRVRPPPLLSLAIPEHPLEQREWHIAPHSPVLPVSRASFARQSQTDYSDAGTGYFSPAQSPDASPTTPVPPSQSSSTSLVKTARLRARSVANGDFQIFPVGKSRGADKMVKERRSLQSFFSASFLQAQTSPIGIISGPRLEASSVPPPQGDASSANLRSRSDGDGKRSDRERSFYSRRRSSTYTGRENALTSPSLVSSSTQTPPMPELPEVYLSLPSSPAGRESPSSYLLDEDPFAVSSPTWLVQPAGSPTCSAVYTPMTSPAGSVSHSRSPSSVSLSSASSVSMPETPLFQSFAPLSEEGESESFTAPPAPSTPTPNVPMPSAPPPTPISPLNSDSIPSALASERAPSSDRILRSLFRNPAPTLDQSQASSMSPGHATLGISSLPQPPPMRARPAHTRPAFASRPSLPSLTTLSRMSAAAGEFASSLRGKKRRGKVGGSLPLEPWDLPSPNPAQEGEAINNEEREDEVETASGVEMSGTGHPQMQTRFVEHLSDKINSSREPRDSLVTMDGSGHYGDPSLRAVCSRDENVDIPGPSSDPAGRGFSGKPQEGVSESDEGKEVVNGNIRNTHGEERALIDTELPYMTASNSSRFGKDTNGECTDALATLATRLGDRLDSESSNERGDVHPEREADQEAGHLIEDDTVFNVEPSGDDPGGGEGFERSTYHPRATAIPKHILRSFTPYSSSSPRSASPALSDASCSSQDSIEDYGILLSSSPALRGDQRPESLAIDPGLPDASARSDAHVYPETRKDQFDFADGASPSSTPIAPLRSSLLSLIALERADHGIETSAERTGTNIDLRSTGDASFAREADVPAESLAAFNHATSSDVSLLSENSFTSSSPVATFSEPSSLDRSLSRSPIREDGRSFESISAERRSLSPQHDYAGYYLNDYDHEVDHRRPGNTLKGEDDSSMLPPLSTLPEEDLVFTLTPAHSRERYDHSDYGLLSSRSLSRKASMVSIFSMRSGSSGFASNGSHNYSRGPSPATSLSTTLPVSKGSGAGSFTHKHAHGSSYGSTDSGREYAPSSSISSLRSNSSVDLRGLANIRRQGSQSSGMSLHIQSSTRTKYEPRLPIHARKDSDVEDVSVGLRAYNGNMFASPVLAELEMKESRYEHQSSGRYGDDELVIDIKREDVAPNDALSSGWKPYDSKLTESEAFEPGSSAGTLRPSAQQVENERTGSRSLAKQSASNESLTKGLLRTHANGYDYSSGRGGASEWGNGNDYGNGYGCYGRGKGSSGNDYVGNYRGSNAGRRGRDNSRDDDRGRSSRRPSTYSSTESESESESESDSDLYGERSPRSAQVSNAVAPSTASPAPSATLDEAPIFRQLRNGRKGVYRPPTNSVVDDNSGGNTPAAEDDDVPIAQRIPGALQAQKSIRQKVRSEQEQRRRERSVAPTLRASRAPEGTISPPPQHVPGINQDERGRTLAVRGPRSAPLAAGATALSSNQEAAMMAQHHGRLPPHHVTHAVQRPRAKTLSGNDGPGVPPDDLVKRLLMVQTHEQEAQIPEQRTSAVSPAHVQVPLSATEKSPVDRTLGVYPLSIRRAPSPQDAPRQKQPSPADVPAPARTLRPMRSFHGLSREPASPASVPAPPVPVPSARRRSPSRARQAYDARGTTEPLSRNRSMKGARRSDEDSHVLAAHYPHPKVHTVPPLAASRGASPSAPISRHGFIQMRIYLGDMQRFNVVEVGLDTSAKDVLDMLREQGDLRGEERRSAGWTLYEVCHDFGMERPVRSFELVADISGSWDKEKTMNCFTVKPSPFVQFLTTLPSSIPTRSGFVDYESKKGKWSKRWLELREHGLWLSKREGKDDEFLCSLSAFDAYVVTRIHKATKNFSFAVKSTDPITLFENKSDYLHVFSVPEDIGFAWLEALWRARSYILYQEKNVLLRNKNEGTATNLARSGARKKPEKTYISLDQPKLPGVAEATGPFEPGSLLAKRAAS